MSIKTLVSPYLSVADFLSPSPQYLSLYGPHPTVRLKCFLSRAIHELSLVLLLVRPLTYWSSHVSLILGRRDRRRRRRRLQRWTVDAGRCRVHAMCARLDVDKIHEECSYTGISVLSFTVCIACADEKVGGSSM
jgi:hypothetical protein